MTISLFDLVKLSASREAIEEYFGNIQGDLESWMKNIGSVNNIGSAGKDLFGIKWGNGDDEELLSRLAGNSLVYETHGSRFGTEGMYIYYKNKITDYDISLYEPNCAYKDYLYMLKHKNDMSEGNYIKFVTTLPDSGYICNAMLDDTSSRYTSFFSYVCYNEKGENIYEDIIGLSSSYNDGSGRTKVTVNENAVFRLSVGGVPIRYRIDSVQTDETSDSVKILYSFPAAVNGKEGKIVFSYTYSYEDEEGGVYDMLGFLEKGGDNLDGFLTEIKTDDTVTADDGTFTYNDDKIIKSENDEVDGIAIMVCDIYGKEYYSEITKLQKSN